MEERMKELVKLLKNAADAYYNDSPIMSDFEYDKLEAELKALEEKSGVVLPDSPTQNVGAPVVSELAKIKHEYPALSLDKTKDMAKLIEKFKAGEQDAHHPGVVLMWKLDGSTVQLTYDDGWLTTAATRGNGEIGSDISHNAPYIKGIPLKIPYKGHLVVRGEAIMTLEEFERINKSLPENVKPYENARNLANATISMLDSTKMREREVQFKAFNMVCMNNGDYLPDAFHTRLAMLANMNFDVVEHVVIDAEYLEEHMKAWEERVPELPYLVDGQVVALDDAGYADTLSGTGKFPNPMRGYAFKWADEVADTVLRDVEWSASRTGLINPVAIFDAVRLEGTSVTRATLHNVSYMLEHDLRIGNKIGVMKRNKIIPAVEINYDKEQEWTKEMVSDKDFERMPLIKACPICGEPVEYVFTVANGKKTDTIVVKCNNPKCLAKQIGGFVHFAERDCMNIFGMSEKTIEKFVNEGFIKNFCDFWHLDRFKEEIVAMEGFGEKKYKKMVDAANKAREVEFVPFVHALGIPNVGKGQAKLIKEFIFEEAKNEPEKYEGRSYWDVFYELMESHHDFTEKDGIGPVMNESIHKWFFDNFGGKYLFGAEAELDALLKEVTFVDKLSFEDSESDLPFKGLTFVITGKVFQFKNRAEVQEVIEKNGGKCAGSVSANTNYLINNDSESGSSKNKKAKTLGVKIITEDEFIAMLEK